MNNNLKTMDEIIGEARQFIGLRNGVVINNIEALSSIYATVQNTEVMEELNIKQDKIISLLESILEEIKNSNNVAVKEPAKTKTTTTKKTTSTTTKK